MDIHINIEKKNFFVLLGGILILAGAIYGYAQPGIAPNPGHFFEELEGVQAKLNGDTCAVGEVVKTINFETGKVSCSNIEASSGIDWGEPITSTIIQDKSGAYDIFFQGGTGSGNSRNLALLGVLNTDKLYVNYASEYTGGTRIGGPVQIVGALTVTGQVSYGSCAYYRTSSAWWCFGSEPVTEHCPNGQVVRSVAIDGYQIQFCLKIRCCQLN